MDVLADDVRAIAGLVRGAAAKGDCKHLVGSQYKAAGVPQLVTEVLEALIAHVFVAKDIDARVPDV